jgi:hypothetical protein
MKGMPGDRGMKGERGPAAGWAEPGEEGLNPNRIDTLGAESIFFI